MTEQNLTYGQKAVGLTFNPSGDDEVARCKQLFADAIDQMYGLANSSESGAQIRLAMIAIQHMQTAQMWGVKTLTWRD